MGKKSLLIITAVLVLGCLYSWRFSYLIKELRDSGEHFFKDNMVPALLSNEQYLELGWVEERYTKNSSFYIHHPVKKSPNVIRIGIFGGSMSVCGGEKSNRDFTYSGLLQEKFRSQGFGQVEVINFGVAGYGMSQEYMLWDFLGRKYDLDYVIFTMQDNMKFRDMTFNVEKFQYWPLHGRYIMDHGDLRFIPVAGHSVEGALGLYYRSIPLLRYVLYDKYIPFSMKVFLPKSLYSRPNPFYYRHDKDENQEVFPIYAAFLDSAARRAKEVIIVADQPDSKKLSMMIKASNVHFFTPSYQDLLQQFPYYEGDLFNHTGALGNRLIADEFFSYLTGKDKWQNVALQMKPCLRAFKAQEKSRITGDLSDYNRLDIRVGEHVIANMRYLNGKEFSPNGNKVKSLLMLPIGNMQHILFLPLEFDLKSGQDVSLLFHADGLERHISIGTVHAPNRTVGRLELTKGKPDSYDIFFDDKDNLDQLQGLTEADLVINNMRVLKLSLSNKGSGLSFDYQREGLLYLSTDNKYFFDGDPFDPKGGTVDLVVTRQNGEQERCPILSFKLVPFSRNIHYPIKELTLYD